MMKKILIVEDEVQLRSIYKKKLSEEGYSVRLAVNGKEALQVLVGDDIPDLILLDIMLPGGQNGFDVLQQIRGNELWKSIPVLVLTNLDSEEQIALSIGANDYMIKANSPLEDVIAKIHTYLSS